MRSAHDNQGAPAFARAPLFAAAAAFVHGLAYLAWFATTPLGRVPVLDGRENFDLARAIAEGCLPSEPFYRAMGWPLLLALLSFSAPSDQDLMLFAGLLGVIFHAGTAWCVGKLALWLLGSHPRAGEGALAAGLLYGFHPTAIFLAAEPLDTTFGLCLMVTGLTCVLVCKTRTLFAAGALLMASVFVRPNHLPVFLAAPVLAFLVSAASRREGLSRAASLLGGAAPIAAAYLGWQASLGGGWSPLPWQGAYNLYKTNGPDGNTRSLVQKELLNESELLDAAGRAQNPTRVESIKRFRAETGREEASIAEMNAYWRAQTLAYIAQNPGRWAGLMFEKLVYLLNDFEQYNNKTFAWHKPRSPVLFWNPLSWGVLFVLGAGGLVCLPRQSRRRAAVLLAVAALCAASALVFMASDRFRLPLAPFCAVFAAGIAAIAAPHDTGPGARLLRKLAPPAVAMLLAAVVTFPPWLYARSEATFLQDRLLAARAALVTGETALALELAREASEAEPLRPDVIRLEGLAMFQAHLTAPSPVTPAEWRGLLSRLAEIPKPGAHDRFLAGIALIHSGRPEQGLLLLAKVAAAGRRGTAERDAAAVLTLAGRADLLEDPLGPEPGKETVLTATALRLNEPRGLKTWQIARLLGEAAPRPKPQGGPGAGTP